MNPSSVPSEADDRLEFIMPLLDREWGAAGVVEYVILGSQPNGQHSLGAADAVARQRQKQVVRAEAKRFQRLHLDDRPILNVARTARERFIGARPIIVLTPLGGVGCPADIRRNRSLHIS